MAGSGRLIERRAAVVSGAKFGLQLASGLIQDAVDLFDEVYGLRTAVQPNSAISFANPMPFVATFDISKRAMPHCITRSIPPVPHPAESPHNRSRVALMGAVLCFHSGVR
jgi:hypothetical protein